MPKQPNNITHVFVSLILAFLRGVHFVIGGIAAFFAFIAPPLKIITKFAARWIILPIYSALLSSRIRFGRWLGATHGSVFLIFTNRYVLHAAIIIISVATVTTQLRAKTVSALDTRRSLLYALVTNGQDEEIEERVRPELLVKNANYLGASTIQAAPAIDYDYEDNGPADLSLPGSIAAGPEMEPNAPGAPSVLVRTGTETYVVATGDTIAAIASRFGVNVGTVIWANNLDARGRIKPGDTLKIPSVSGVLYTIKKGDTIEKIAKLHGVNAADVYSANHLTPDHLLALGEEVVIPGATPIVTVKPGKKTKPSNVRSDVPRTSIRNKSYDQYQELTQASPDTRQKPPGEETAAEALPKHKLLWPTVLRVINQYYGWRHTGVDIDGDYTDAIYAADDGVVEKSGWNSGGYGLMIMLDHGNGMKTRYGHASKLFVQEGDEVKRGQVIAMVGTTGRSTGTHLHFEVYVNGRRTNPLAYIR